MALQEWIALITLGLTIINAIIAGIIVPLYLNNKIAKTQRQIIQFQDEITRTSQLAILNIDSAETLEGGGFNINNSGQASAKNIRIAVYPAGFLIDLIEKNELMFKLEDFDFLPLNNALNFKTEIATRLISRPLYKKPTNGVVFTIDMLPSRIETGVVVVLKNEVQKQICLLQGEIKIKLSYYLRNIDVRLFEPEIKSALLHHYNFTYCAGIFHGDVSCDNCREINGEIFFAVPTIESFAINIQSVSSDYFIVAVNVQYFTPLQDAKASNGSPILVKPDEKEKLLLELRDEEKWSDIGAFVIGHDWDFSLKNFDDTKKKTREKAKVLKQRYRIWKLMRWI